MSTVTTPPTPDVETVDPPRSSALWSTATTPGWYRVAAAATIAILVGFAALATAATVITRNSAQAIRSNTAPSLIAVQGLSASVAEANASAAAVFLSTTTGAEDRSRRVQYLSALERSAEQAEEVASLVGDDPPSHDALQAVAVALTTYSGEIEASRTASGLGATDADDTFRSALDLTRGDLAAAVATVTERNQNRFDSEAETGLLATIGALVLGVISLVVLIWFQLGITKRSNRIINVGLATATILVAATVVIIGNGGVTRSLALSNAESGGYDAIAATSALQASANELQSQLSLRLLGDSTGEIDVLVADLDTTVAAIGTNADSTREEAAAAELATRWARYRAAVESIAGAANGADSGRAITEFQDSGLSSFNGLNLSIESVLSDNRTQFSDGVDAAADAVNLLPLFSLVLPLLAVIALVFGVQARLRDYQ